MERGFVQEKATIRRKTRTLEKKGNQQVVDAVTAKEEGEMLSEQGSS